MAGTLPATAVALLASMPPFAFLAGDTVSGAEDGFCAAGLACGVGFCATEKEEAARSSEKTANRIFIKVIGYRRPTRILSSPLDAKPASLGASLIFYAW